MQINNQEKGRSMVEMVAVLAVIGVLTVGAISTVNFGLESVRTSSVYALVENTAQGVSDLYSWNRSFPNDDSPAERDKICSNKVFDEDCLEVPEVATVATPWGTLSVNLVSTAQFKITLTDVPYRVCNKLKDMKWVNVTLDTSVCTEEGEAKTDMVFYGN